jgi:lysophospholipase L1-like esterase
MKRFAIVVAVLAFSSSPSIAADPPKLELKDGDRIVYLGNTFAERDQSYGYLETLLTIRHPDINFTFRNLGWSGDTVWGDARARFGTRADGFKHLKEHVLALKPTVILVAYGMNESFAGEAGLKEFEAGLNTLLDTLAETKARIVLISPIPMENLGPPLPNPDKHNADLKLYSEAMGQVAADRTCAFIDLFGNAVRRGPAIVDATDDGLHFTPWGHAQNGRILTAELVGSDDLYHRELDAAKADSQPCHGWTLADFHRANNRLSFTAIAPSLPEPPWPAGVRRADGRPFVGSGGYRIDLSGVPAGEYQLKIDGKTINPGLVLLPNFSPATPNAILTGPEIDQVEKLRALINKKNELYFHRWRPQNETYLFGFRKHEQGNNAIEIPQFDPLIAELEAEINKLKKPVKHTYEIIREEAGK